MRTKRINLVTYEYGRIRRVYKDVETEKLYYKVSGSWFGTFIEYCYEYKENLRQKK